MTESKQRILDTYIDFISKTNKLPTNADFIIADISRSNIRDNFGNLSNLHRYIKENHRESLDQYIAHSDYIFNEKRLQKLSGKMADSKVFVITTAVTDKLVDINLFKSIKSYLNKRNGQLIVITSEDIASRRRDSDIGFVVDPILRDEFFVTEEFRLNSNLFISNIKVSAKQIVPTTGLARIGQTNGSYIFGSPKQMLEYVATSPNENHPKAIMTTGAITTSSYNNDRWMSQRTSYIAEHDHVMGGVIVEIVDDRYFHFRHFQANREGEFIDLGIRYKPDGSESSVMTHLYAGDWHSGQTDERAVNAMFDLMKTIPIENFMVGDFFDGHSISHHHINQPLKQVLKSLLNTDDLLAEIWQGGVDIQRILKNIDGDLILIRGNHDDVLEKYLNSGNFMQDRRNMYLALDLARSLLEGNDVLSYAYQQYAEIDFKLFERVQWLQRDQTYKIGDVECGQHGDMGANGSKGSLTSLEKAYGNCVVGHSHSAAIMRGVFRVGTMTKLVLEYNKGPSSWTQTCCLVYDDGSRQLVNVVDGSMFA